MTITLAAYAAKKGRAEMLYPTKVIELNPRDNEHIKRLNDPADAGLFHLETWLPFAEAAKLERGNANVRPASERKKPFRDMVIYGRKQPIDLPSKESRNHLPLR